MAVQLWRVIERQVIVMGVGEPPPAAAALGAATEGSPHQYDDGAAG